MFFSSFFSRVRFFSEPFVCTGVFKDSKSRSCIYRVLLFSLCSGSVCEQEGSCIYRVLLFSLCSGSVCEQEGSCTYSPETLVATERNVSDSFLCQKACSTYTGTGSTLLHGGMVDSVVATLPPITIVALDQ